MCGCIISSTMNCYRNMFYNDILSGYKNYFKELLKSGVEKFELDNFVIDTATYEIYMKDNLKTRTLSTYSPNIFALHGGAIEKLYVNEVTRFYIENWGKIFSKFE